MFVSRLRADDQRPSSTPLRVTDPALEEVEAAIKRLDGFYFTEVTLLGNEEETSLHITGGREGRYLCQMISDEDVKILVDPSNPSRETVFILENRQGDYPRRLTVGLDLALQAARTYAITGTLDPKLCWEDF